MTIYLEKNVAHWQCGSFKVDVPRVTVLMPVYNGAEYVAEAIESILAQTFSDFEFLIINDGSTDNSVDIIQSYNDQRIRLIHNERNSGLIATLNKGLDLARGEYVARMDCDDISLPDRLEKQLAYMDEHPEVAVLGCAVYTMDTCGNTIGELLAPIGKNLERLYWRPSPHIHPSVIMRVSALDGARYESDWPDAEDYGLWLRLKMQGKVMQNIPDLLLKYRVHGNSVSATRRQSQLASSYQVFQRYVAVKSVSYQDFISLIGVAYAVTPFRYAGIYWQLCSKFPQPFLITAANLLRYMLGWLVYRVRMR